MNYRKLQDKLFGDHKEMEHIETISKVLNISLNKIKDDYATFDYEGDGVKVELKSRRNYKYTYPTTMIGINKINEASVDEKTNYYFCFSFTDKLCYIKYDKERFNKYPRNIGGRTDRGKIEMKEYVFIPVRDLIDVK